MQIDPKIAAAVKEVAEEFNLPEKELLTVVMVESNGQTHTIVDGNLCPVIRWEGHVFYRNLPQTKKEVAVSAGLASKSYGQIPNPKSQPARYMILEQAKVIDEDAAICACSYGVGQVLGENWKILGYKNPRDFYKEAMNGLSGQIRLMVQFIMHHNLDDKLRLHDWAGFAAVYNGPQYKTYKYDLKMATMWKQISGNPTAVVLKMGSSGPTVSSLQGKLTAAGYPVKVDGYFGQETRMALRAFQSDNGLDVDGIAGADTWRMLKEYTGMSVPRQGEVLDNVLEQTQKFAAVSTAASTASSALISSLDGIPDIIVIIVICIAILLGLAFAIVWIVQKMRNRVSMFSNNAPDPFSSP